MFPLKALSVHKFRRRGAACVCICCVPALKPLKRLFVLILICTNFATAQTQTATVTHYVYLRSDASTSSDKIERLTPGARLQLVETNDNNGFYHVTAPDGQDGWVWGHNIRILGPDSGSGSNSSGDLFAQLMQARRPASGQPLVENGAEVCGPTGDAKNARAQALNNNKNRTDMPGDSDYVEIGWNDLAGLPSERENDFVGAPVRVVGFLSHTINVENTGKGESTNCHLRDDTEVDWHIYLTNSPAQAISQAIIVETTPRTRPQHRWTTDMLAPVVDSQTQVRISGWLMYDSEHVGEIGTHRATVWEVHPITRIEVQQNGEWVDLDHQP
jgi:Bacterial SH3 domain